MEKGPADRFIRPEYPIFYKPVKSLIVPGYHHLVTFPFTFKKKVVLRYCNFSTNCYKKTLHINYNLTLINNR